MPPPRLRLASLFPAFLVGAFFYVLVVGFAGAELRANVRARSPSAPNPATGQVHAFSDKHGTYYVRRHENLLMRTANLHLLLLPVAYGALLLRRSYLRRIASAR